MKCYIFVGPPGCGKGTHSVPVVRDFNLCHLSTGELLREQIAQGTELGLKAKSLMDAGNFVPDEVVEGMIASQFDNPRNFDGFLLDGFPRTLGQARDLDAMLAARGSEVTGVIGLMIPEDLIRARIKGRAVIEGRADDANDEIITNRINTYHEKTEPIIDYYKSKGKYYEVDGDGGPGEEGKLEVYRRIRVQMEKMEG